jgi:hypothetical protein
VAKYGAGLFVGLALAAAGATAANSGDAVSPAVVELFTSQGCSSCPPADEILGQLATRPDLIALSLSVDYWDYLGWRDTLADHAFTERQRAYAAARGDGQVYTPQVVINGMTHAVGSRLADIEKALATTSDQLGPWWSSVALRMDGDDIVVDVGEAPSGVTIEDGRVLLAWTSKRVDVAIAKGENRGRTITYHNVVRKLVEIGRWAGKAGSLRIPRREYMATEIDGCVVLLQRGVAGPIVGAARLAGL